MWHMFNNYWNVAIALYVLAAVVSFLPVALAIFKKVNPNDISGDFDGVINFDEKQLSQLQAHFQRMRGTLSYWKNGANKYKKIHFYTLIWTIPSSVLIPILTQSIDGDGLEARGLVTVISAFTAILLSFHKVLKVEEKFRAFRKGESGFYDAYRRILDRPKAYGDTPEKQIEGYFLTVEALRQTCREFETDLNALGESLDTVGGQR